VSDRKKPPIKIVSRKYLCRAKKLWWLLSMAPGKIIQELGGFGNLQNEKHGKILSPGEAVAKVHLTLYSRKAGRERVGRGGS
jgi:hypothetical protein